MIPDTTVQMHSTVHDDSRVELTLDEVELPPLTEGEVLIRMEASPINPSDLGNMFAGADLSAMQAGTNSNGPTISAPLGERAFAAARARVGDRLAVGNEGAGIVIAAGAGDAAQELLGRTVAIRVGTYAQHRVIAAQHCLVLPDGTDPKDAASCFVNPLTALGMVDTMRLDGHKALVHTAAASNLGQMLIKICLADGVPLVNVVRSDAQVTLLRELGATYVCNANDSDFTAQLTDALAETGATVGFDATGGGRLASNILHAMETALSRGAGFSRYGTTVHKQVYLYGNLQLGATELEPHLRHVLGGRRLVAQ